MKWFYAIKEKLKIAIALTFVLILVLVTNTINKYHFTEIKESFTSVYEDRLLVENYIYKLSTELNAKQLRLYSGNETEDEKQHVSNGRINELIKDFKDTKLTEEESEVLHAFAVNVDYLKKLELKLSKLDEQKSEKGVIKQELVMHFTELQNQLSRLSEIQMEEGKKLVNNSKGIVATNYSYSRLEIIVVIIMGLIIQALIFASKSVKPTFVQNQHLN